MKTSHIVLNLLVILCTHTIKCHQDLVDQMASCVHLRDENILADLHGVAHTHHKHLKAQSQAYRPLLEQYPRLCRVPHVPLADLPTPIHKLEALSSHFGTAHIYIKRDDQTGIKRNGKRLFGGNKVRKLEFLLADAYALGCKTVLTFGCVGSNHAAATAFYARQLGMHCVTMLKSEPNSHCVRRNIAFMHECGADMHFCTTSAMRTLGTAYVCARYTLDNGSFPYCIPTGGSCPRGILGFVNAALELKEQIEQGLMPMPDIIYLTVGGASSGGSTAGLLLGLCIADLPCKVVAVSSEPEGTPGQLQSSLEHLFYQTNEFIHSYDPTCALYTFPADHLRIELNFAGPRYAQFTQEGVDAMGLMQQLENIELDGVYTGKACAALCHDLQEPTMQDKTVLFWNTFYACPFDEQAYDIYKLPLGLREYFLNDVQELDFVILGSDRGSSQYKKKE